MKDRCGHYYNAGLEMLSHKMYGQSVICFYFSVLQQMMYSLKISADRPIEYEKQNPLNESVHERIPTDIIQRVKMPREANSIKELFGEVLELRKKADYSPSPITLEECLECREKCESLKSKLHRFFKEKA